MSDTPRTDYAATLVQYAKVGPQYEVVTAEFARQLERENRALRGALELIVINVQTKQGWSIPTADLERAKKALKP